MKIDLFDRYDIRTRICAFIFIVSPFLLDAYIFVDAVRNFSTTVIITAILIASSGLFTCWIRYCGNNVKQKDYIAESLVSGSNEISEISRKRYLDKLVRLEPTFAGLTCTDAAVSRDTANSVSAWLREKTRGDKFKLIHEENLNYGFIRNISSVKTVFLYCFTAYNVLLLLVLIWTNWDITPKTYFQTIPAEHVLCGLLHVAFYLVWILGINEAVLDFAARKYAKAVLRAIDEL